MEEKLEKITYFIRRQPVDIQGLLSYFEDQGDKEDVVAACEKALEGESDGDTSSILMLLKARMLLMLSRMQEAEKAARKAIHGVKIHNEYKALGYSIIATIRILENNLFEADGLIKKSYSLTKGGQDFTRASVLNVMGALQVRHGRNILALSYFDQAFELSSRLDNKRLTTSILNNTAVVKAQMGRSREAVGLYKRIRDLSGEKDRLQYAYATRNLANQYFNLENYENAELEARKALALFKQMENDHMRVMSLLDLGWACFEGGKVDESLEHASSAMSFAEKLDMKNELVSVYSLLAAVLAKQKNPLADEYFRKAVEACSKMSADQSHDRTAFLYYDYGRHLLEKDKNRGLDFLRESAVNLEKQKQHPYVERALLDIAHLLEPYSLENLDYFSNLITEIETRQKNHEKTIEISQVLTSLTSSNELLETILDRSLEVSGAERGLIAFYDGAALTYQIMRNFLWKKDTKENLVSVEKAIIDAINSAKPLLIPDVEAFDGKNVFNGPLPREIKAVFVIPLRKAGEKAGALYMDSSRPIRDHHPEVKNLLETLMDYAAVTIERTGLYEQLNRLNEQLRDKIVKQDREMKKTRIQLENKQQELETKYIYENIIGRSGRMRELFRLLDKVVETDLPVYIYGESGTGKELVARAIHYNGRRKKNSFLAMNCAAIPEGLIESELFGYERGAFTGAEGAKPGMFEAAQGGTVFLDEIGDMSLAMQQKLLRITQEKEVRRIGSSKPVKIDVRIISASNKDLRGLLEKRAFREDLFYRLNVIEIRMPSLRERREDIPLLFEHFWKRATNGDINLHGDTKTELFRLLMDYQWPGNVRELENETNRLAFLGKGEVELKYISENILESVSKAGTRSPVFYGQDDLSYRIMEKKLISTALEKADGNKAKASRILGIPRTSLYAKMKKLGLS